MTKFNFVKDGGCKLPPGFRFQPTEEEIVFQYLAPKIFSCPLPAAVIPEIDNIFSFYPWDLPGESEKDKYFFSNNRESKNYGRGSSSSRAISCGGGGFWRVIGLERQIIISSKRRMGLGIVGMKKTLLFCKGRRNNSTDWIMHCYSISVPTTNIQQGCLIRIGKWDLCHIFVKKRSSKLGRVCNNDDRLCRKYGSSDSTVAEDADSSCASCSTDNDSDSIGSTEVSSNGDRPK